MSDIPEAAIEAGAAALRRSWDDATEYGSAEEMAACALEAAAGTLERQAIQEFIETSGFYLARELSEAACYRQSLGTPCGKQHPHIEVVYGVSEEIVAEYLTRKGTSDE